MREPIFEVHSPDGDVFRIWADGRIDGFPPGSMVLNRAAPRVHLTLGLLASVAGSGLLPEEQRAKIVAAWEGTC
jgi:hypothetical protein